MGFSTQVCSIYSTNVRTRSTHAPPPPTHMCECPGVRLHARSTCVRWMCPMCVRAAALRQYPQKSPMPIALRRHRCCRRRGRLLHVYVCVWARCPLWPRSRLNRRRRHRSRPSLCVCVCVSCPQNPPGHINCVYTDNARRSVRSGPGSGLDAAPPPRPPPPPPSPLPPTFVCLAKRAN